MSSILHFYIIQIQPLNIQIDWGVFLSLITALVAVLALIWNMINGNKKIKKEAKKEAGLILASKLDKDDFEVFKKTHSEKHAFLEKVVDSKASKEVVEMMHDDIKEVKGDIKSLLLNFSNQK